MSRLRSTNTGVGGSTTLRVGGLIATGQSSNTPPSLGLGPRMAAARHVVAVGNDAGIPLGLAHVFEHVFYTVQRAGVYIPDSGGGAGRIVSAPC